MRNHCVGGSETTRSGLSGDVPQGQGWTQRKQRGWLLLTATLFVSLINQSTHRLQTDMHAYRAPYRYFLNFKHCMYGRAIGKLCRRKGWNMSGAQTLQRWPCNLQVCRFWTNQWLLIDGVNIGGCVSLSVSAWLMLAVRLPELCPRLFSSARVCFAAQTVFFFFFFSFLLYFVVVGYR